MMEKGFYPGFIGATRPNESGGEGTCIDNIYIKTNSFTTESFKLLTPCTDHYLLFLKFNMKPISKRENHYFYYNYDKLQKIALTKNWNIIKTMQDPIEATSSLIAELQNCLEKSKVFYQNKSKKIKPRNEWISKAIIISCKKKVKLYFKMRKNPNNDKCRLEYKEYTKRLDKIIREGKNVHEKNFIKKNISDSKLIWKYIREKLGTKSQTKNAINKINVNNETLEDPTKMQIR